MQQNITKPVNYSYYLDSPPTLNAQIQSLENEQLVTKQLLSKVQKYQ